MSAPNDPNDYTTLADIPEGQTFVLSFPNIELKMAGLGGPIQQRRDGATCLTYADGSIEVGKLDRIINGMRCFEIVSAIQAQREGDAA